MTTASTLGLAMTRGDRPVPLASKAFGLDDAGKPDGPGRKNLLAGAGSTEYDLWTGTNNGNGSAFTATAYKRLCLIVDPDDQLQEDDPDRELGVWVKCYYTAIAGGSSTAIGIVFFVTRAAPFIIPSSIAASGVTITREITRITAFNANASDDVTVQLEVELAAE